MQPRNLDHSHLWQACRAVHFQATAPSQPFVVNRAHWLQEQEGLRRQSCLSGVWSHISRLPQQLSLSVWFASRANRLFPLSPSLCVLPKMDFPMRLAAKKCLAIPKMHLTRAKPHLVTCDSEKKMHLFFKASFLCRC